MSQLVARILLSIAVFPLAAVFYLVVFVGLMEGMGYGRSSEDVGFLVADLATWIAVGAYWFLLWRRSVVWNRERIVGTVIVVVGAGVIGVMIGVLCTGLIGRGGGSAAFGIFVGGAVAILLSVVGTIFEWRETPAERAARLKGAGAAGVACPTCGYNLTGLSESRCPECGSKFTLDELLLAQPARAGAEID